MNCYGTCPYCGERFEGVDYEHAKFLLKKHLREYHYDELMECAMKSKDWEIFGENYLIEWCAGHIAYRNITCRE